jgi:hypothetical protein
LRFTARSAAAHRPAHEAEILADGDYRRPPDFALGDQHRILFAGRLLCGLHAFGIFLLVAELQRVHDRLGHLHLGEHAAVEQRAEPFAGGDRHVVIAVRADVQVVSKLAVEQHRPAFGALGPQVFGHLAAREQRIDLGPDVVGDPVHRSLAKQGAGWGRAMEDEIVPAGAECNRRGEMRPDLSDQSAAISAVSASTARA